MIMTIRLAYLASHNGSAARAITNACKSGLMTAQPIALISNNPDAGALQWAAAEGLQTTIINARTSADVDQAIAQYLQDNHIDLVCCSGYMKLIGPRTIAAMKGYILNVHPALLPSYGGQGMYGSKVHQAVHDAGDTKTGITIHLVDGEYDHGKIIAQKIVPLDAGDTPQAIEQKVKDAEPDFYVETLTKILSGGILSL